MFVQLVPFPSSTSFNPASLFASGEQGDYWIFNRAHTNAASSGANMTTATGTVNGHVMSQSSTGVPTLDVVSGVDCCLTTGGSAGLSYTFGADISQPGTIVVALLSSTSGSQNFVGGSSSTKRWQISRNSGGGGLIFAGATLSFASIILTQSKTLMGEFNSTSSNLYQNAVLKATGDAGSQVTNQVRIGTNFDGSGGSTLRVFALLFINRLLTSTEKANVNTLFAPFTGLS